MSFENLKNDSKFSSKYYYIALRVITYYRNMIFISINMFSKSNLAHFAYGRKFVTKLITESYWLYVRS